MADDHGSVTQTLIHMRLYNDTIRLSLDGRKPEIQSPISYLMSSIRIDFDSIVCCCRGLCVLYVKMYIMPLVIFAMQ